MDKTLDLSKVYRDYNVSDGVYNDFPSRGAAHQTLIKVLKDAGYVPNNSRTWVKLGCPAIVIPRYRRR